MNKKIKEIIKKNQYRSKFYQTKRTVKKPKTKPKSKQQPFFKHKSVQSFINKTLVSMVVLMVLLISHKDERLHFLYEKTLTHMNFAKIDHYITDTFGGFFPRTSDRSQYVNHSIITVNNSEPHRNGLMVHTNVFEPVQSHVSGIVIKIYEDKELGRIVVIQDRNGHEYHYGHFEDIQVRIYQRVEYGETIGMGRISSDMRSGVYFLAIKSGFEYLDVLAVIKYED